LPTAWSEALARHGLKSGQVLLTLGDTEERRRYLNARATIGDLLNLKVVPVINENDTVATSEIRYGDNDRLAARVATMTGADLLVLLSDIDGLYTAPPGTRPKCDIHPCCRAYHAGYRGDGGGAASELSRGGMRTKIDAGKIATVAGTAMIIASGRESKSAGGH
jgi:glutamate 5-kinase